MTRPDPLGDPLTTARRIYAELDKTATRSLPTEQVGMTYGLWGDGLDRVIAASCGHLRIRWPGLLEAVKTDHLEGENHD